MESSTSEQGEKRETGPRSPQETAPGMTASETPEPSLLRVRDLAVTFSARGVPGVPALRGLDLDLDPGEALGVMGESGAGKSTLAQAILGILPPEGRVLSGSIHLRGAELLRLPEDALAHLRGDQVSLVSQEPGMALSPLRRIGGQVADVIHAHRPWPRRRCREAARTMLGRVGLGEPADAFDAYPHQLSGGQLQRVALAQALICGPSLLIADEPTAALDAVAQGEILSLLRELRRELGIAILFISHDPALLAAACDRLLVLYAGRMVEEGPTPRILDTPLHPYVRGLLRSWPEADGAPPERRLPTLPGGPPDPAALPSGCAFHPRCPERAEACRRRSPRAVAPEPDRRVRCFSHGD